MLLKIQVCKKIYIQNSIKTKVRLVLKSYKNKINYNKDLVDTDYEYDYKIQTYILYQMQAWSLNSNMGYVEGSR